MAWRSGSLSRSLISTARTSSLRSSPPLPRVRTPPLAAPRVQSRRFPFATAPRYGDFNHHMFCEREKKITESATKERFMSRNLGELGCTQSLLPLGNMWATTCLTSHLAVNMRAFCELSHGT